MLHVDLIRRVSADHVQHRQSSARMLVQPCVQLKDSAFTDHNRVASGNLRLNFRSTEDPITTHYKDGEGTEGFLTIGRSG